MAAAVTAMDWAFDGLLACVLPVLAWRVLASDDLRTSVVLFIAVGLVSAMAWARLGAPDIALVEAAVGAGLTGALLMNTLGWIRPRPPPTPALSRGGRGLLIVLAASLAAGVGAMFLRLPASVGLTEEVQARLADSGVAHPVTAVLLNFRAYDTLLEIAVLLVAVLAVRAHAPPPPSTAPDPLAPLLAMLVRVMVPASILVAGYLLWKGTRGPGGAFQAGAVLGGVGILLILAGTLRPPSLSSRWVRGLLVVGLGGFVAAAALPLLLGGRLLEYPAGSAKLLIFAIELVLTISIALVLMMFFPGTAAPGGSSARPPREDRG